MTRPRKPLAAPSETVVLATSRPVQTGPRSRLVVTVTQWRDTAPRVELRYEVRAPRGYYPTRRRLGLPVSALVDLRRALEDVGEELRTRRIEGWRARWCASPEEE